MDEVAAKNNGNVLICPYNKKHAVLAERFQQHVMTCKRLHPQVKMAICIFNNIHEVPQEELQNHQNNCPDRALIEKAKLSLQEGTSNCMAQGMANPAQNVEAELPSTEDENWDDMDAPAYNPAYAMLQKPICRSAAHMTRSEKRAFRAQERIRIDAILKKQEEQEKASQGSSQNHQKNCPDRAQERIRIDAILKKQEEQEKASQGSSQNHQKNCPDRAQERIRIDAILKKQEEQEKASQGSSQNHQKNCPDRAQERIRIDAILKKQEEQQKASQGSLQNHQKNCPDRAPIELAKLSLQEGTSNCMAQGKANPAQKVEPELPSTEDENWDDMDAPAYNPAYAMLQKPICRSAAHMTRSEKRAFRAQERIRIDAILKKQEEQQKASQGSSQ